MTAYPLMMCGCQACAASAFLDGPEGQATLPADKPTWTLDQVVTNILRWDARWAGEPVPFAFYTSTPPHLAGNKDYSGMVPFSFAQQAATRDVLATLSDVAVLSFVEVSDNQLVVGEGNRRLTYATSTSTAQFFTAYANVGINESYELGDMHRIHGAEMMFNAQRWSGATLPGSREYSVLIHETLHALGLPHPSNYNRNANEEITYEKHAVFFQDTAQYTVMSYFSERYTGADYKGVYASTPLLHDIAALHAQYGADMTARTGDTVYGFNATAGRIYDFSASDPRGVVFCIWDAGGEDTLDASGFLTASRLDLNPGAFSSVGGLTANISIAFGAQIERARGGAGNDVIVGNAGANGLYGGAGEDFIDGGAGRDDIHGDVGSDHVLGGADGDRLHGGDGDDRIGGQDGDDFIDGGQGRDTLFGDAGRDHMVGGSEEDRLHGQDGDDLIGGQDGDDFIDGGAGRDTLFGDAGADHMIGGGDGDALIGQDGDDLIGGQDGDDFIDGGAGRDTLYGDAGNDHMVGGAETDALRGQDGDDLIGGEDGDDLIEGGAGRDMLYGDAGDDVIVGGAGSDQLFGQAGADRFVFAALSDSEASSGTGDAQALNADFVRDFNAAEGDRIDLSGIDANAGLAGDQAFLLVSAFTGQSGQAVLRQLFPGETLLQLDVNGDGVSDFDLRVSGVATGEGLVL